MTQSPLPLSPLSCPTRVAEEDGPPPRLAHGVGDACRLQPRNQRVDVGHAAAEVAVAATVLRARGEQNRITLIASCLVLVSSHKQLTQLPFAGCHAPGYHVINYKVHT